MQKPKKFPEEELQSIHLNEQELRMSIRSSGKRKLSKFKIIDKDHSKNSKIFICFDIRK